jgi:pimeloyl-ACP methyl ester carboxylesterase
MLSIARLIATSAASLALASAGPTALQTPAVPNPESGYAPVNGLKLYYEIRGTGAPVVVLHGGLSNTELIEGMIANLARTQRVIAVDLQGHGRTADIDRPFSCEAMADDIAALLRYLKVPKADIVGYSLGGSVALRTAIQHPEMVNKLVVVSAVVQPSGWYPEGRAAMQQVGAGMAEAMKPSPAYQSYARIAPRPGDWPVLLDKTGALLRQDFDWTREVKSIAAPTLLVFGDADAIRPEHMVEFFHLLGGGTKDGGVDGSGMSKARLAILPGTTHYAIFDSPLLPPLIVRFLAKGESRTASKAE